MIRTLAGENSFLIKQSLHELINEFTRKHSDLAVARIDCEDAEYQTIYEEVTNISLFEPVKTVILYAPSKNRYLSENIEQLITATPETTELILVDAKLDKRLNFYKTVKKLTDYKEFAATESHDLARWAVDFAKNQAASLSVQDARYLVDRVGTDQLRLSNEIVKLSLYNPHITRSSIDLLCDKSLNSSIFDLLDVSFGGNQQEALRIYDELRLQKIQPPQIIGMLSWQLLVLSIIKSAAQRTASEIASQAKLSPYVVNKSMSIAKRIGWSELKQLVKGLQQIDLKSKTTNNDTDEMLRLYLLQISE